MWVRVTPQGNGQFVERVNPDMVLIKIRDELNQRSYMDNIADVSLNNLSLMTRAILKKVALNPSVFQCFQYVSNVKDPDTGANLLNGDFGDYISWCAHSLIVEAARASGSHPQAPSTLKRETTIKPKHDDGGEYSIPST